MNNRNGLIAAGVIAVIALILAVIQSGNLSQSEVKFAAVQTTATAQQAMMTDQWVEAAATLSAASTLAADAQQKAITNAENAAATAQASSLADAANAAATAQAKALGDAANTASTLQAQALAAASQAAATAQANALKTAANTAATAQAKSVEEAENAAATQQAQSVATLQAGATATLGAVVNAAENAQAEAVTTAKAQAVASQQAQATATLGAVIAQAATDRADYQATEIAVQTQIATINDQLATAQAIATNAVNPTAVPTTVATGQATAVSPANPTSEATSEVSGVPADWKRYVGKGVAIQLPESYLGSDLGTDPQALGKLLRSLGPDFAPAATLLESNPEILSFIAVHQGNGDDDPAASVIILSIPLPTSIPINTLLEATISQLPSGSKVLEKGIVQVGEHEAGRMIVETHVGAIVSTQLQYYIIANNTLYLVGFTGVPKQFEAQLPAFEQSMTTFEILAAPGI